MNRTHWCVLFACVSCVAQVAVLSADEPRSLDEVLATKASLEIQQDSFEQAVATLVRKVRNKDEAWEIKIVGKDLQLEGITKNQSIRDFRQQDKSVAEILTALVLVANPDRTIKDPQSLQLKLIWAIGSDPDDLKREILLITTREAAKKRGDKLPKSLMIPSGKE